MTQSEVRAVLIKVLASKRGRNPADLEKELLEAGSECPCDSQWLVKAGVGAAKSFGISFKPRSQDSWAFASMDTMAKYLHERLEKAEAA